MKPLSKKNPPRNKASTLVKEDNTRTLPGRESVAEAAYYRAERRGFAPGGELQDWLDAEYEVSQASTRP